MIRQLHVTLTVVVVSLILMLPVSGHSQADPVWLRQWNQAWSDRPEVLTSEARIAAPDEPGDAMILSGEVVNPDGSPAGDVLVHAYHRDRDGFDFGPGDAATRTWRLQGWARTSEDGRFRFHSIRPAVDHMGREAAHMHFTLISPDYGRQWARKVYFADDALVSDRERKRSEKAGEFGWVREVSVVDGVQTFEVRFRLKRDSDF